MDLTNREITTELESLINPINDAMENSGLARPTDFYLGKHQDHDYVETMSDGVKVRVLRLNKTAVAPLQISVEYAGTALPPQNLVVNSDKAETLQRLYSCIAGLIESAIEPAK